jgi:hypothetical protein
VIGVVSGGEIDDLTRDSINRRRAEGDRSRLACNASWHCKDSQDNARKYQIPVPLRATF